MKDRLTQLWSDHRDDAFIAAFIAVLVFGAFGFGRATAPMPEKTPLIIEKLPIATSISQGNPDATVGTTNAPKPGAFVASKNGTKYYLPSCSGANRIKEENKIFFASAQEAKESGYEPAANCPGL